MSTYLILPSPCFANLLDFSPFLSPYFPGLPDSVIYLILLVGEASNLFVTLVQALADVSVTVADVVVAVAVAVAELIAKAFAL